MLLPVLFGTLLCCAPGVPPGSPETGYSVYGIVWESGGMAAVGKPVVVLDMRTGQPAGSAQTRLMGKYVISGLMPGTYVLQVGKIQRQVLITDANRMEDVDLSKPGGALDMTAGIMEAVGREAKKLKTDGVAAPGKPGGDPAVAKKLSGKWYGFSGTTTLTGGGGSESQMAFCPDGLYHEAYESGYHGTDSGVTFGTAHHSGGKGTWSVKGSTTKGVITVTKKGGAKTKIPYQVTEDDPNCYHFDGRKHCFAGACK